MASRFGKTIVQQAQAVHTATVIVLHGLGDTAEGWAFLGPELKVQGVKWVYPTAPTRPITLNGGVPMPGWFDLDTLGNVERYGWLRVEARKHTRAALAGSYWGCTGVNGGFVQGRRMACLSG